MRLSHGTVVLKVKMHNRAEREKYFRDERFMTSLLDHDTMQNELCNQQILTHFFSFVKDFFNLFAGWNKFDMHSEKWTTI